MKVFAVANECRAFIIFLSLTRQFIIRDKKNLKSFHVLTYVELKRNKESTEIKKISIL